MNRLHHLKKTLPQNLEDNIGYPKIEFVVLDYSSKDGLSDWIYDKMSSYVEKGILKFYRTDKPESFVHSHAKNAVSKLATGEVLCNIDADNYTGLDFAHFVNKCFLKNDNIFLHSASTYTKKDNLGRICVNSNDFNDPLNPELAIGENIVFASLGSSSSILGLTTDTEWVFDWS